MTRALSEAERGSLHRTFEALCRIPSPTLSERAVADWLIAELGGMGVELEEDDAGKQIGASSGNLLARLPGTGARTLLLCAHMDTVPATDSIEPVQRDGGWQNGNPAILGADNKAAVAAIVEVVRRLAPLTPEQRPAGLEVLFTVAEETGLNGAKEFDVKKLVSDYGYVFDHASPLGEIIVASPTYMRIRAQITGRAAHAGLEPELGVNAIRAAAHAAINLPQGRLDPDTTANVGTINGGTATNVVPDLCTLETEVRSIEQTRVDEVTTLAIDTIQDAADSAGCDADIAVQKMFAGYRLRPRETSVKAAEKALKSIGYEPTHVSSGGGSDANALRVAGFACTNLANGTERAHQRTERVSNRALEDNLRLMLALIDEIVEPA